LFKVESATHGKSVSDEAGRASESEMPRLQILVVEDDFAIRESVTELLVSAGYTVVTACNGRDALNRLQQGLRPAIIMLDLTMPVMDGWDFRQAQLRDEALKAIPTLIITAAGFSRETMRLQFGDVDFVRKPLPPTELLAALDRRRCYRGSFDSAS